MNKVKRFVEECNADFKPIYRKYIWNEARFDRKLLLFVGGITIIINTINIISITVSVIVDADIKLLNLISILSFVLFLAYILIVVALDKIYNHDATKRMCEEELEKSFREKLAKYGINSGFQQFIVLSEIHQMKDKSILSDGLKRILTLAANTLLIPIALIILERITETEPIIKQFKVFLFFIIIVIVSLVIIDIVAEGMKEAVNSKYEKIEYYLKKNALK